MLDGLDARRVFTIGTTVSLIGLSFTRGFDSSSVRQPQFSNPVRCSNRRALCLQGGAIKVTCCTTTISKCSFYNCAAYKGGAVAVANGNVNFVSCEIYDNFASNVTSPPPLPPRSFPAAPTRPRPTPNIQQHPLSVH